MAFACASVFMPFVITCVMLLAVVLWAIFKRDTRQKMFCDKTNIPLYIFSAVIIVVPLIYKRYISAALGIVVLIGVIFFIYLKAIINKQIYNDLLDICCVSSLICFFYAIVQKLIQGIAFRATGGLLNANYYGTICEIVIIIAVYRLTTNKKYSGLYIPIIAINIIGICLCDCQSAWIAVMTGIIAYLFFSGHKKYGFIVLIVSIALIAIGVFTPGLLPRMSVMPQTFSTRKNIWMTAIKGIKAHWLFGQGTFTYLFTYMLYKGYKTYHAHSLYLDPLLSYGVVGTSILLYYIIGMFKAVSINLRQKFNREIMSVALGVIFAVCVHGITDITVLWVQTGMLLLTVISGVYIKSENKVLTKL